MSETQKGKKATKLYAVQIETTVVVEAENVDFAHQAAKEFLGEIKSDTNFNVSVLNHIKTKAALPAGWDEQCIAYGGDGNTRIEVYLA